MTARTKSASPSPEVLRLNVLGVGVSAINLSRAVSIVDGWIASGRREYVCVTGVHGVMESRRDSRIREIHNKSGLVTPDGMPLVWLLRNAGCREVGRVYGPDLMLALLERGREHGHTHFLYGSTAGTLKLLVGNLSRRIPGIRIAGTYAPPFGVISRDEDDDIVDTINRSGAKLVWVGLSTPKQEIWMAEHRSRLSANVLIGVGAAFPFHAGLVRQAPPLVQRAGLEWLFRLTQEPRRLWRRYLRNNPRFITEIFLQQSGLSRYSLDA
jgi:N-acetylglucosaminyldiphosphoundecaprenol N-acetyl-beta-D-mannosaminyltransferase